MTQKHKFILALVSVSFAAQLFFAAYLFIDQHDSYTSAINISGKQRMLSQRIALLAHDVVESTNTVRHQLLLTELSTTLKLFKNHHQVLLSGDRELSIPALQSVALKAIYFRPPFQLDKKTKLYISLSESVLSDAKKAILANESPDLIQLTQMATRLLEALDVAVWQYQRQADIEIEERRYMAYAVMLFMLLTLLLGIYEFTSFTKQLSARNKSLAVSKFVFEHSSDGLITTDAEGIILTANNSVQSLTGYASGAIIGHNFHTFIMNISLHESLLNEILKQTAQTGKWRGELLQQAAESKPLSMGIRAVYDKKHETTISNYVISITDISTQKISEDKYRFLSQHDKLTGLLNRSAIYQEFKSKAAAARRDKTELAVLMMDLDGFKSANDIYGHDAGDQVLIKLSERIEGVLRETDALARFGGDEFIVLASYSGAESNPEKVAEKILGAVSKPVCWQGNEISIGISIGITTYSDADEGLDQLIKQADAEMYRVKRNGKNNFSRHCDIEQENQTC